MKKNRNKNSSSKGSRVPPELGGRFLEAVVKELFDLSWSISRRWIERGKVFVDGKRIVDGRFVVPDGVDVSLNIDAPRPRAPTVLKDHQVIFIDRHLVVVSKPPGMSTIPFVEGEKGALVDEVRRYLARPSRGNPKGKPRRGSTPELFVVQRLDKGSSGLLVFPRTYLSFRRLKEQLREHSVLRRYVALAHGHVESGTISTHLLEDRGDGLRGSRERSPQSQIRRSKKGKLAITHIEVLERFEEPKASLLSCRLETGRTNQIRIHLSEAGHPLLGDSVYSRDYRGPLIPASRLMLHAGELGFVHPATGEPLRFEEPLPSAMSEASVFSALRARM